MKSVNLKILFIIIMICLSACRVTASEHVAPKEYLQWLEELKQEMSDRGISQQTLEKAFAKNYYHPRHKVVKHDRNQNEFVLTTSAYLKRAVSRQRIEKGRQFYKKLSKKYPDGIMNVPLHYLIAFWGVETNYGSYKGGYPAIEALTVLSYDARRPKFFREELYKALKILDERHIEFEKMESSWAGAMGHFQFMPSTFLAYGKDANNDDKINIWEDFDDAILSAANYLSDRGWKKNEPWGMPVNLDINFDYTKTGRNKIKTVKKWKEIGVIGNEKMKDNWEGAIIVPEGYHGQSYLILDNFHIIMKWNKSENYALAIGLLADEIKGIKRNIYTDKTGRYPLTRNDIKKVQEFINKQKIAKIDIDGALGSKTRQAVQKVQKKFKLPADGYPDYRLLKNIANFPQNGYYPPVPNRKLHRGK